MDEQIDNEFIETIEAHSVNSDGAPTQQPNDTTLKKQARRGAFSYLKALVFVAWFAFLIWSYVFLPRVAQLYESFEQTRSSSVIAASILAARYSIAAMWLPLSFLLSAPNSRKGVVYGLALIIIPSCVFLATFVPWIRLHYAFE